MPDGCEAADQAKANAPVLQQENIDPRTVKPVDGSRNGQRANQISLPRRDMDLQSVRKRVAPRQPSRFALPEGNMVMLVTLLTDIPPGTSGMVRSHSGDWPAVWAGGNPGVAGVQHDVEIELGDEVSEIHVDDSDAPQEGIYLKDGQLMVCGTVTTVFDDGIVALDIKPGTLLLEASNPLPTLHVGQVVCASPSEISVFPTGI
ncbi:hypothetical protein ACTWPB_19075 [Nocardia sp. IBHARD005]|uniref:hypothetical protein n=1 Tax=Nocardia sp. IBHARD005 TaxID=3457765 RepID=UPI004059CC08